MRPNYAELEPAQPSVNLALNVGSPPAPGAHGSVFHSGIQATSTEAVERTAQALQAAGYETRLEEETACLTCTAGQGLDPRSGWNPWEVFVVLEAGVLLRADSGSICCTERSCESAMRSRPRGGWQRFGRDLKAFLRRRTADDEVAADLHSAVSSGGRGAADVIRHRVRGVEMGSPATEPLTSVVA